MLDADQLVHTAVLERYTGDSDDGATYAAPVDLPCYFEGGAQLVDEPVGTEIGALGTFYANPTEIPVGSRVGVRGETAYVSQVLDLDDSFGLAHLQVEVSSRPTAGGTRAAEVAIGSAAGVPTYNESTEQSETVAPDAVFSGAARITPASATVDLTVQAADDVSLRRYLVAVAASALADVTVEHVVRVTSCPGDPSLVGRMLSIDGISHGSANLETVLHCTLSD